MCENINLRTEAGRRWVAQRLKSNGSYTFLVGCGQGDGCPRRVSFDGLVRCGRDLTVLAGDNEGQTIRERVVCGVAHPFEMD